MTHCTRVNHDRRGPMRSSTLSTQWDDLMFVSVYRDLLFRGSYEPAQVDVAGLVIRKRTSVECTLLWHVARWDATPDSRCSHRLTHSYFYRRVELFVELKILLYRIEPTFYNVIRFMYMSCTERTCTALKVIYISSSRKEGLKAHIAQSAILISLMLVSY